MGMVSSIPASRDCSVPACRSAQTTDCDSRTLEDRPVERGGAHKQAHLARVGNSNIWDTLTEDEILLALCNVLAMENPPSHSRAARMLTGISAVVGTARGSLATAAQMG